MARDNHLRLTGLHETQAIDKFSYGLSDRGASSGCLSTSSRTATRAIWKIDVRIRKADPYQIVSPHSEDDPYCSAVLIQPVTRIPNLQRPGMGGWVGLWNKLLVHMGAAFHAAPVRISSEKDAG